MRKDVIKELAEKYNLPESTIREAIDSTFLFLKSAMKDHKNPKKITINKLGNFIPDPKKVSKCCNALCHPHPEDKKVRNNLKRYVCSVCNKTIDKSGN